MSYSREAIVQQAPVVNPQTTLPAMKEERVLDPYAGRTKPIPAPEAGKIGQPDNNSSEPAEPKATEETVTLSPQMAALARKEQKFRREEQAIKQKEAQLNKDLLEVSELKAMKEALASGDYSKLNGLVSYDKYAQWVIDQSASTDPSQQALKKLETEVETIKKQREEDTNRRFEAAVNDRRNAVKSLVETKPEFANIKKLEMAEAVVQHILTTWNEDEVELTPEQAAKEVSEFLKEQAKVWASALDDDKPEEVITDAPNVEEKKNLPPLKPNVKTLTNSMTVQGEVVAPKKSFQHMSDQERWAEARRRAEEKLKQQRG